MDLDLEQMLNKVIDQLQVMAKTETVIGASFKLAEFDCVPVIKISMGFGSGGGSGEGSGKGGAKGGGAGAGITLEPLGFLVTKGDEISMVSISRSKGLQSIFEKVPDLLETLIKKKMNQEKE